MSEELQFVLSDISHSELNQMLPSNEMVSVSISEVVSMLEPHLPDLDELVEVTQTGMSVDTNPFPGDYNFRVQIHDSDSKQYTFSEKLNRLYCNMDRAVPITFKWEGSNISYIRAMMMFEDPDSLNKPVFRCRTHNDETSANNQNCPHYKHILRCDDDNVFYDENKTSRRHSVIRPLSTHQNGSEGVNGLYRFMCNTTCSGVDAVARRRTRLVLTSEDSNFRVVGRAGFGVKICSCPLRDKKRDEEDVGSKTKKRKVDNDFESKRILKRELISNVVPPSPINIPVDNVTTTVGNTDQNHMVKREMEGEATRDSDFVDLQVSIPNFPRNKAGEFQSSLKRLVASFYVPDDYVSTVTQGVQIRT